MKSTEQIIEKIDVADLDFIYLSYDEPQKEEFWVKIKNMIPWAKRVDGVHGSDAAHKAAAEASSTERFVLIDGDNMPDANFLNVILDITESNRDAQFRWRAKNIINHLYYGNGGISSWTREYVRNMRTHENTDGSAQTNIEFCFDPLYWPMHDCYSVTYPNYSAKQAWRAGFREGVKLCTRNGTPPPSKQKFLEHIWPRNLKNLLIWQSIGRDVENGFWAIHGARCGTYYLMLSEWDHTEVRDFNCLNSLWEKHQNDDQTQCGQIGQILREQLGLPIVEYDHQQSLFFKKYGAPKWCNMGPMIKEMDVIRKEEGW